SETLSTVQLHTGITYAFAGRFADAVHAFAVEEHSSNKWRRRRAKCLIAVSHALCGDMAECMNVLEYLRNEPGPAGWQDSYTATGYHLAESLLCLDAFDLDGAERHLSDVDTDHKAVEFRPLVLRIEMLIALARKEPL